MKNQLTALLAALCVSGAMADGVPLLLSAGKPDAAGAARLEAMKTENGVGKILGVYNVNPSAMNANVIAVGSEYVFSGRQTTPTTWAGKRGHDSMTIFRSETSGSLTIRVTLDGLTYFSRPVGTNVYALYQPAPLKQPDEVKK